VSEGAALSLGFRMADGAREDAWFRDAAARVVGEVVGAFGAGRIAAVVLSGSLARGEGGILWDDSGRPFPVADLDLYVVAHGDAEAAALRSERHALLARLARGEARADVGVVTPAGLAALPATLGNLALVGEGRVVWGDGGALARARRIAPREIPRSDALNLVLNRAAEELFALRAARRAPADKGAAVAVFQRGVKTVADVALAVLMARGESLAAYAGRAERLAAALAEDAGLRRALPPSWVGAVEAACRWKVAPRWEDLEGHVPGAGGAAGEAARAALARRVEGVRGFAAWYAGGARDPLRALERSEGLARAARAWARHGRVSARAARTAASRLLAGRARPSPRLSVQLAALALFLASAGTDRDGAERAAARLLPDAGGAGAGIEDAVLAAWGREIMDWREA
jgi:hypothetical protein